MKVPFKCKANAVGAKDRYNHISTAAKLFRYMKGEKVSFKVKGFSQDKPLISACKAPDELQH